MVDTTAPSDLTLALATDSGSNTQDGLSNTATVNVSGSRNMVAALKKAGANVTYLEIPGGSHSDVVVPNLPKAFEFLAAQRKAPVAATQQQ